MRRALPCVLVSAFSTVPTAYAVEREEAVVVSATRTAQSADVSLTPVIVITRAEIEAARATDVADLLRLHAGVDIGRNGGAGQSSSVFIRGAESNHTLVLIDGVKINPATIGGAAFQNISPEVVERIEVVKGPRSTLYGSEAIGGVINIITRRAERGLSSQLKLGGGSYDSRRASANLQWASDTSRVGFVLDRLQTDGFSPQEASSIERGHDNTSVNVYGGYRWNGWDAELSHWQARGNTEYLDFFLTPLDQDFANRATTLKFEGSVTGAWATTLRLSRVNDEIDQNQGDDFAHTERDSLDWQHDVQFGDAQLLTAGIYLSEDKASSLSFGTGFSERIDSWALFAQDDIELGAHRWLLAARHTNHESFDGHTVGSVEYGYALDEHTRLTMAVGTGFRAPDSTDRFGFGGNPNLEPETSRNAEVGVRHALNERQRVSFSLFDNRIDDLIDFGDPDSWAGPLPGQMENIGHARIRGLEASYVVDARPFGLRVEAIAQEPKDLDRDEPLPRRARRSLTAAAFYDVSAYRLGAELVASSRRKDSAFSSTYNSGYGLVNLTAHWQALPTLQLGGRIENLFDKDYVLAQGYNTGGRIAFVELRYVPF